MTVRLASRHQPAADDAARDSWQLQGACRAHPDLDADAWFPGPGERAVAAVAVCRSCPVNQACAAASFRNEEAAGIWGGIREVERAHILRHRDKHRAETPPPPPDPCGTLRGYKRHRRNGENACGRCCDAAAAHVADWRNKRDLDGKFRATPAA